MFPKKVLLTLLLFSFFSIIHCGPPSGEFGFATTNDEEIDIIEKELYNATDYIVTRNNLYFTPKDTIHYLYTFKRSPGSKEFVVTLQKESLGFVEIDLKKKTPGEDGLIKDRFSNLEVGRYQLNLVYDQEVIDSVIFNVIYEEGYSSQLDGLENDTEEKEEDEIIKYSRM